VLDSRPRKAEVNDNGLTMSILSRRKLRCATRFGWYVPPLISSFEVKSRGRVVTFAPVQFNDAATIQTRLICR
jgi:hypothetical protein